MATCYLVLGTPRSGTSCVSGILHKLGVRMSLGDFVPASPANPTGFWEDTGLFDALSDHDSPYLAVQYAARNRLMQAIYDRHSPGVDWGAKTYLLSIYFDVWMSVCDELGVTVKTVMTSRDIEQSKASWRNAFSSNDAIVSHVAGLIAPYQLTSLSVSFDALLSDAATTVASIASYCGKPTSGAAFEDAVAFVNPSLRNYP